MPAKHTLNVSLTEPLRDFVDDQVRSGRFQTGSEVVRAALRLLQDNTQGAVKEQKPANDPNGTALSTEKGEPHPVDSHRIKP